MKTTIFTYYISIFRELWLKKKVQKQFQNYKVQNYVRKSKKMKIDRVNTQKMANLNGKGQRKV